MKIAIWGTGSYARHLAGCIVQSSAQLVSITDSFSSSSFLDEVPYIPIENLKVTEFDYILIAVSSYSAVEEIQSILEQQDIPREKYVDFSRYSPFFICQLAEKLPIENIIFNLSDNNASHRSVIRNDSHHAEQGVSTRHYHMILAIQTLAEKSNQLNILELGSWLGESLKLWTSVLQLFPNVKANIVCVDLWDSFISDEDRLNEDNLQIKNMESLSQENRSFELFYQTKKEIESEVNNVSISCFRGRTDSFLTIAKEDSFDFIYVDASHYYDDVLNDIHESKRILKPGGILCGDDLEVESHSEELLTLGMNNKKQDYVKIPGTERFYHPGVSLAVKHELDEVGNYFGFWGVRKSGASSYTPLKLQYESRVLPPKLRQGNSLSIYEAEFEMLNAILVDGAIQGSCL